jgi:hypothetical protein
MGVMQYLAQLKSLPNVNTGEVKLVVPTLYQEQVVTARPKRQYLGIMQPYSLDEVVFVEIVENVLYYSDRLYGNGEYSNPVPDSHAFVTPYGYIAFTPTNVIIKHKTGGEWVIGDKIVSNNVTVDIETGKGALDVTSGTPIMPTKWR